MKDQLLKVKENTVSNNIFFGEEILELIVLQNQLFLIDLDKNGDNILSINVVLKYWRYFHRVSKE